MAVHDSRCDSYAVAHFRHSGQGGYVFEEDLERFDRQLRQFEKGRDNELNI
jgi:hypothetical protein